MTEANEQIEIICPHCNHIGHVTEKWKVFNCVICPNCLREFALPWCRDGFEPKGDINVIMTREDFMKLTKKKGWDGKQ